MMQRETMNRPNTNYRPGQVAAVASLFVGATVWGVIWYPYRLIEAAGISGAMSTALTYAVALIAGLIWFGGKLRGARVDGWLIIIALASGGSNLGYVLGMLQGEVMHVLLLFYLAPLWTILLARLLLHEPLTAAGAALVGLSLSGAAIMLWQPELGVPWPQTSGEWIGLGAGMLFALANVSIRRASHYSIELKSLSIFTGVVTIGLIYAVVAGEAALPQAANMRWTLLALIVGVGGVMLVSNVVVLHGLTKIPAGRAAVILLSELVVAAFAAWWLADETMGLYEYLGGGLIVAASLISAKLES
jgi:drug/metabolite transporter (DMT)-like permease